MVSNYTNFLYARRTFPSYVIVRLDSAGLWSGDWFGQVGWSDVTERAVWMIASGDKKSEVHNGGGGGEGKKKKEKKNCSIMSHVLLSFFPWVLKVSV